VHHRRDASIRTVDFRSRERKLRQAVSLPAQKRSESEVVIKTTEGRYIRRPATKSFNADAELQVAGNPSQLPRQVS
jgi:ribosomal protein L1